MANEAQIAARIASQSVEALKEMAALLVDRFEDGADLVFAAVLSALEARMPEAEFVAFADAL